MTPFLSFGSFGTKLPSPIAPISGKLLVTSLRMLVRLRQMIASVLLLPVGAQVSIM